MKATSLVALVALGLATPRLLTHAKMINPHIFPWTPDLLGVALEGWYDSSDSSTITESGGSVSQLDDKSGNAEHLVQAVGANKPTTDSRTQNGLNVLDCDGDDFLENLAFPITGGDIALFIVAEIDSVDANSDSILSMNADAAPDWQFDANNALAFDGRMNVTSMGSDVSLTGGAFAGPSIYNINFDKTGAGIYNAFIDGTQRAVNTTYSTAMDATQELRVFQNRGEITAPNGAFAEVILITDFTTVTREKIEGYLAHKWGLTANLPSGHPYKNLPPTA